ncbi:MAG: phosphate signaling complex protein PhoU [Thermoleophilaceae bacterium]|nr:phosphate signaling complex protein PhoU [Thermoleophilaceae bacterium]
MSQDKPRMVFQEDLSAIEATTLSMFDLAAEMTSRAVESVLNQDIELARIVIESDDKVDNRYLDVSQRLLNLIALQAPVASDLRLIAALLSTNNHVERMGDLAVNIAKAVPLSGEEPPVDATILNIIEKMGLQVHNQINQAKLSLANQDAKLAENLVVEDDILDALNKEIFRRAIEIGTDEDRREWAILMVLIGRHLERIGDNCVDIGEQVAFVVTGEFREFTDASAGANAR